MKFFRKFFFALLIYAMLFTQAASAHNFNDENNNGIVDHRETGELVAVVQTRLRELGYFHFKSTGNYQSMTRNAVIEFQKLQQDESGNPFIADGTIGEQSKQALFSTEAVRATIPAEVHMPIGPSANGSQTQSGALTPWEEVKASLTVGSTYTLIDYNTGTTFKMVYTSGENHAEMECASPNDTTLFKEVFGGEFNYSKRPMLLSLPSGLVACSLQGQPHGEDTVSQNDMDGHACLFFDQSKSHVGMLSDIEHNNNVLTASGTAN